MANTDGEPLEFMTLHYRLEPEARSPAGVAQALADLPDLHAAEEGSRWTWFAPSKPRKGWKRKAEDDPHLGRTIHGEVVLEDKTVEVRVNSEARADRVRALLAPALAGLVREPLIERTTLEQAMAAMPPAGTAAPEGPDGVDPADLRRITHEVLDRQYRETLADPVPILGCKSPRARWCAAKGRWSSPAGSRASSRAASAVRPAT